MESVFYALIAVLTSSIATAATIIANQISKFLIVKFSKSNLYNSRRRKKSGFDISHFFLIILACSFTFLFLSIALLPVSSLSEFYQQGKFIRQFATFSAGISTFIAIRLFEKEVSGDKKREQYEAFLAIDLAQGKTVSYARFYALQDLNSSGVSLSRLSAPGADLAEINLERADLRESNLENSNLQQAILRRAILRNVNLSKAILSSADLQQADLWQAVFSGARLFKADFQRANLQGASFHKADLTGADLKNANLQGASFQEANLTGADLENANLQDVDFSYADLKVAILEGANIRNSNFIGAKIETSQIKTALNWEEAIYDKNLA